VERLANDPNGSLEDFLIYEEIMKRLNPNPELKKKMKEIRTYYDSYLFKNMHLK
jgi:hypothetical protein